MIMLYTAVTVFLLFFPVLLVSPGAQETAGLIPGEIYPELPDEFVRVEVRSSVDGAIQPAIFYSSGSGGRKPLIVSLHSWSADYTQRDQLAPAIHKLGWNYIRPDFRGRNNKPEACGSPLVLSDIKDAIDFAIENARVNRREIHIIGHSGGGFATLLCYMKLDHRINSFSAWNSISDLVDWYYESLGRGNRYADDILKATSSEGELNADEAISRSPFFMDYPGGVRKGAKLFIYHGIHDGYTGSVSVTQSLNFFNELVRKIDPREEDALIPERDIMDLLVKRCYPPTLAGTDMIGDRKIHYAREYGNIRIIIFEGGHELLHEVALELIPVIRF